MPEVNTQTKPLRIRREHLLAALAVWDYCEASARYVWGDALGDPVADEILAALRAAAPAGLTRTNLRDLFTRNRDAAQISNALRLLLERGLATCSNEATGGRPVERWTATNTRDDINDKNAQSPPGGYLGLAKRLCPAREPGEDDGAEGSDRETISA